MAKAFLLILSILIFQTSNTNGFQLRLFHSFATKDYYQNQHTSTKSKCRILPKSPTSSFLTNTNTKTSLFSNQNQDQDVEESMNPVTKASWYAVEAFGKIFGQANDDKSRDNVGSVDLTKPPSTLTEAFSRIELDNKRSYFLSGEVDVLAYDPQCVFSDPFVAFSGRERFVDNLANLGSFITEYDARMLTYEVDFDTPQVQTKVMVKLQLNLPWKPILAWPWGVTYKIDPGTFLITEHQESWDIDAFEGVKQIFRKPTVTIKKSKIDSVQ